MSLRRRPVALISASTAAALVSAALAFAPAPVNAATSTDDPLSIVPVLEYATSGTVQNSLTGSTSFDPFDDRTWIGFCDPSEVSPEDDYGTVIIDACDETPSTQRMVWTYDDQNVLAELSPDDIVSARFQVSADLAWVDEVGCKQGALELYAGADWSQEPTAMETYAPSGCEGARTWNGYFGFDATDLAKQAASGDGSLAVGLKAADETCMSCGWNRVKSGALQIVFNRAPAEPASLQVGTSYPGDRPCTSTPQWLNSDIYASAYVADPDTAHHGGEKVTATFRVFPTGQSPDGTPLYEVTATERYADARIAVAIPPDLLTEGAVYDLWVTSRDGYGKESGPVHCTFGVDRTDPEPPTITPVVGGEAVYVAGVPRGGSGIPGYFWIRGGGSDVETYLFSGGTSSTCGTGTSAPATDTTGFSYRPDSWAVSLEGRVVACAIDRAGNRSETATYVFEVASSSNAVATPPAITVSGGSSYTYGSTYTSAITLSADAVTPYGEVTVSEGSTVLGGAAFDARTESVTLPAKKLAIGSHTLTYTYRAFPGAPTWSTTRTVKVVGVFTAPTPTISGTAKVGKTLTASRGTWSPTPSTVTYVWKAGTTTIKSSTSNQLVVPASAKGKQITVSVVGARSGYTTKTMTSAKTAVVVAGTFTAPRPYITGTVEYGHTVAAVRGTWSPSPSSVTYVWKINGTVVKRGTSASLFLPKAWNGKQVTVTVIGSRTGYTSKTITSYAKTI